MRLCLFVGHSALIGLLTRGCLFLDHGAVFVWQGVFIPLSWCCLCVTRGCLFLCHGAVFVWPWGVYTSVMALSLCNQGVSIPRSWCYHRADEASQATVRWISVQRLLWQPWRILRVCTVTHWQAAQHDQRYPGLSKTTETWTAFCPCLRPQKHEQHSAPV